MVAAECHWVNDTFRDLVVCGERILAGEEVVACRWQGPLNEGHYLDFTTDPAGGLSIAVHSFRYPEGDTYEKIWSAERGELVASYQVTVRDFAVMFAQALRRVRSLSLDSAGLIRDYPWPFPQAVFERVEALARPFGYQPRVLSELRDSEIMNLPRRED